MNTQHTPGPWTIKPMFGLQTGNPSGFSVERINRNRPEGCDLLERGRIFRSEADARGAIAKATSRAAMTTTPRTGD